MSMYNHFEALFDDVIKSHVRFRYAARDIMHTGSLYSAFSAVFFILTVLCVIWIMVYPTPNAENTNFPITKYTIVMMGMVTGTWAVFSIYKHERYVSALRAEYSDHKRACKSLLFPVAMYMQPGPANLQQDPKEAYATLMKKFHKIPSAPPLRDYGAKIMMMKEAKQAKAKYVLKLAVHDAVRATKAE